MAIESTQDEVHNGVNDVRVFHPPMDNEQRAQPVVCRNM